MLATKMTPAARPTVQLLPGHDRRLRSGHPWAFANELHIDAAARRLPPGGLVRLCDSAGRALGVATFNVHSLIAARLLDQDPDTAIDRSFFAERLAAALALRAKFVTEPYYRLVHAEADNLPGLIVDRYGSTLAMQTNTAGMEAHLPELLAALDEILAPKAIVLRNDTSFRHLEGLESYVRVAKGELGGPAEVLENGARFFADLQGGQKTGWFFDLRSARQLVAGLAAGAAMLDLYCHSGGFAVQAALAGAREVIAVDRSTGALDLARAAAEQNGVAGACSFVAAEVFGELAARQGEARRYAVVVADPPNFVKARKELKAGIKAYRKLTRLTASLVASRGFLFIASCSHHVPAEEFAAEVARGLTLAERSGRIVATGGAGPDHPVHPHLPESAYLKWQLLQLD